jgi:uncharacterized BrkB/YihY/UPF0761 family membrane protein
MPVPDLPERVGELMGAAEHTLDSMQRSLQRDLAARTEQLAASKRLGPFVAATRRFFEVEGLDLAGLLAIELFTTVIPLILLGFSWANGFSSSTSFGDFLVHRMKLSGYAAEQVNRLFDNTASLRSTWTVAGLAGFLVWGIPMSSQVAKMWARAYRRERFRFWAETWRGCVWFVLALGTYIASVAITNDHHGATKVFWVVLGALPTMLLWSLSPVLLVRNGSAGWRYLFWSGIVGLALDTFGVRLTLRFVFPALLGGWKGFGPIGVAMSMMTTSGVIAVLWVATACLGAVLWERFAPEQEVVASQQLVTPRRASTRVEAPAE